MNKTNKGIWKFFFVQGDVDTQTIEEYLELEKKIANAEHTRYLPIYLSIYLSS